MTLLFIRVFFLIISSFVGFFIGSIYLQMLPGLMVGAGVGCALILLESSLRRVSVRGLSSMVFGLLLGVFMAKLIADILSLLPLEEYVHSVTRVVLTLVFSYLGAVMALRGKDEFHLIIPYVRFKRQDVYERIILLDSSALIDGRISDIYKTNFFAGRMVVPRFILQELQKMADLQDLVKRQKGRRGIEVLRNMQKDSSMALRIHEEDDLVDENVDTKLVQLAKVMEARVCTTDYNLGRVATIQGVEVLNINELASAVKSVVFVGDDLDVRLVKEGREPRQAVAYTDDGTMIVVADAQHLIGKKVKINVNSILPTQAGKIVFAKLKGR
ncbi:MAG: twitching motility protein PilT [Candidatus Omnitrophica bacterium]|nr:twitching motility protein PilT [Candidatus Omnitrophota bacterium]